MNILLMANHLNTGGITTYMLTLAKGLINAGDHVWVVSSGGDCEEELTLLGARHIRLDIRVKSEGHPKFWLALPKIIRLVNEHQIDCLHAQTRVTAVMAALVSQWTKKPYITTCHGFFKPRLFRLLFPCWGSAVIAISNPVREHLEDGFNVDPKKICLIPNGIDLSQYAPASPKEKPMLRQAKGITGDPVIGIIARLSSVKAIDVLIAAMPIVVAGYPDSCLWIVGTGDQEAYLKECVAKRNLEAHVKFLPAVKQAVALLPLFDVFVMPSIQEGLGLSVMEAQASGVPVVASRVGGLVDLVEDGKTGFSVLPQDHAALAQAIIAILQDPERAALMARAAKKRINERFDAIRMVQETRICYEQHLCR